MLCTLPLAGTDMDSPSKTQKPHAICIPFPAQGHINPMLKLATLLHHKGFHITFVHTEYNHKRLLQSSAAALSPLPDFQFATIPDGLPPPENANSTQDVRSLCLSTRENCLAPLNDLIGKINDRDSSSSVPPVSCVIADALMTFALQAAERIGVPGVMLQTASAVSYMCNNHIVHLVEKGFIPLKDESCLNNGYLDTIIDWIPGVIPPRLKDFSNSIRTTDPNDPLLDFMVTEIRRSKKAAAIIINTFDSLEHTVLSSLSAICPPIYTLGSLHLLLDQIPGSNPTSSSLWKEDLACLNWLASKPHNSVIYINFGSITVLDPRQLSEFAWGIAQSGKSFLWVVRPDMVRGQNAALPPEFWEEVGDSGFIAGWSPQEAVLGHAALGGFLTHCGWNSMMESLCAGVPMLCWPLQFDQRFNCKYACEEWGVGMEIGGDVKRDEVGFLVRELIDGESGKKLKSRALEWREKAATAAAGGSSSLNLERLISDVLRV